MEINNVIKETIMQNEPKAPRYESVFQQAMVNIFFTHNYCNEKVKQALMPYEITTQQFNVLRILRGQYPKPCTVNLLKSRMLDKMCDASRIVDRVVQKEWVNKKINPYDKRAVDVIISDKGLALLSKLDEEISLSAIISPKLSYEEAVQLNELLDKINS